MKVISFYSMKGGVGKTAAAVNCAFLSARGGRRTLLCDLDPQGASSYYLKVTPRTKHSSQRIIKGGKSLAACIRESDYPGLDILPSDLSFGQLDIEMSEKKHPLQRLRRALSTFREVYDVLILDSPPNITLLSENILESSDYLFIPVIPTVLSLISRERLLELIPAFTLEQEHIYSFISMADRRKSLHKRMIEELQAQQNICRSIIPYCSDIEKMGLYREPVMVSAPGSTGAAAYDELWEELRRIVWK